MVTIGELNRRIDVERLYEDRDEFGGVIGTWVIVGHVWAKVEAMSGSESIDDNQMKSSQKYRFVMRFYPMLETTHRILYMGKTYEIISTKDIVDKHRFTEVIAKEVTNGNLWGETKES